MEAELLSRYLDKKGYSPAQISKALDKLQSAANKQGQSLFDTNKEVYQLLRYGVPVKVEAGKVTESVYLIDWQQAESNDFYLAEEVTVFGEKEKRPDIVLYINGIAKFLTKSQRVFRAKTSANGVNRLFEFARGKGFEW
ncbi:MAG: type I restriction endonuclease [Methylococcales bacterium]